MTSEFNMGDALEAMKGFEELQGKINDAIRRLKEECTCPEEMRTSKEYYFSGSYNDQAYTEHWMECVLCGKRYDKRIENHSWYG